MKKLYLSLVLCLGLAFVSGCSGSVGSPYHSPWDLAQPADERRAAVESSNAEQLKPQVDWRDQNNIRHDIERTTTYDNRKSLEVIDVEGATSQQQRQVKQQVRPSSTKVKVAFLAPMSGPHEAIGNALFNAAQLALFDVGSENFELIPRDTKGTPNGAQEAARSALQSGADLILGPLLSDSVSAVKPVAATRDVPVVAFSTDWRVAGNRTYIMGFLPYAQVARVTNYALAQGYDQISIFAPQGPYSDQVQRTLSYTLSRAGQRIAKKKVFSPHQNDLETILSEFVEFERRQAEMDEIKAELQMRVDTLDDKAAKEELKRLSRRKATSELPFNAMMIPLGGQGLKTVSSFLGHFEVDTNKVKLLGTGLWDDATLTKEPVLHRSWFAAADPGLRSGFLKNYEDAYGQKPPRLASLGYDATALAAILAQNSNGLMPSQVYSHDRLTSERGFAGIDGIFRFRSDGLVERGLAVLEIRPDKIIVIDPAPSAFLGPRKS